MCAPLQGFDSPIAQVAGHDAERGVAALQWSTQTSVSRDGTATRVGVARAGANGGLTLYLADSDVNGGGRITAVPFGQVGDVPLSGDWDGDGHESVGVWRPAEAAFYLRDGNAPGDAYRKVLMGVPGDRPVVGPFGTDPTRTSIGVYHPATGTFRLASTATDGGGTVNEIVLGGSAPLDAVPVAGDWDGDGDVTVGVHHPATGTFDLAQSNVDGGGDITTVTLGRAGDLPLAGDWNGDGITETGVRRPGTARFHLSGPASDGGRPTTSFSFGRPTDIPFTWTP